MNKENLKKLNQFDCSAEYHKITESTICTDGVKFLADNADCYWFLTAIASWQNEAMKDEMLREMQFWKLMPYPQEGTFKPETEGGILHHQKAECRPDAILICERDTGDAAIIQEIGYTDFPFDALPVAKIWAKPLRLAGSLFVSTLLLPSEY